MVMEVDGRRKKKKSRDNMGTEAEGAQNTTAQELREQSDAAREQMDSVRTGGISAEAVERINRRMQRIAQQAQETVGGSAKVTIVVRNPNEGR